jgi:hypothetical protein
MQERSGVFAFDLVMFLLGVTFLVLYGVYPTELVLAILGSLYTCAGIILLVTDYVKLRLEERDAYQNLNM